MRDHWAMGRPFVRHTSRSRPSHLHAGPVTSRSGGRRVTHPGPQHRADGTVAGAIDVTEGRTEPSIAPRRTAANTRKGVGFLLKR